MQNSAMLQQICLTNEMKYDKIKLTLIYADVMELADMQDLGSCATGVQVQVLSSAPKKHPIWVFFWCG